MLLKGAKNMDELAKAQHYICDKNTSLVKLSHDTGISYGSLRGYRNQPQKLATAAWKRVHLFAELYDKQNRIWK